MDIDYLKQLQEAMAGKTEAPQEREEYITDPNIRDEYVTVPEQELEQVNEQAESPYMQEKEELKPEDVMDIPRASRDIASISENMNNKSQSEDVAPEKPLSAQEKLIQELRSMRSKSKEEAAAAQEKADSKALWGNVIRTLGDLGAADVQRGAGIKVGLKPSQMQQAKDVKSPILKERDAMMKQLMDEYKLLNQSKKDMKDVYKVGDELVRVTPEGKAESLYKAEKDKEDKKELTKGQIEADKAFAKDYNEYAAQGGIASIKSNINKLKEANNLLKSEDGPNLTGAGLGLVPDVVRNAVAPESIAVRDMVESVIQQSLRQILGAQFTEKEAERLIQRSYNEKLDEKTNAKKLDATIKELETMAQAKEQAAKYFEKNGTLRGFKSDIKNMIPSQTGKMVLMKAPNGQRARVPENKVQDYIDKGATVIEE
jgi:hypothetical protein